MRMSWGFCENIFDNALGQFTRALILLQDDEHRHARLDGRAGLSIHEIVLEIVKISYIPRSIAQPQKAVAFSNSLSAFKIRHP
jgi:hypothetical protein